MPISDFARLIFGRGPVAPPSPGNRNNAPFPPPVQSGGTIEWIQRYLFNGIDGGRSMSATAPYHVPPAYQDWGAYAIPEMDYSGLEGGGVATLPEIPSNGVAGSLFYDPQTGIYYTMAPSNE